MTTGKILPPPTKPDGLAPKTVSAVPFYLELCFYIFLSAVVVFNCLIVALLLTGKL